MIKKAQPTKEVIHIDAAGQILGRLATKIALLLRGKDKSSFVPNKIPERVIYVEHANAINVTGRKIQQKMYHRHSMYPGGLKSISFEQMMERDPQRILEWAVYGMLPKNRLRARMMQNLIIK